MTAVSVTFFCVAAALACAVVRAARPEMAFAVALAAGAAALLLLNDDLRAAVELVRELAGRAEVSQDSSGLLLRAAGVALVSEFGAQLCKDAGESALAGRIDLAARVVLLVMAAPLIGEALDLISGLLA